VCVCVCVCVSVHAYAHVPLQGFFKQPLNILDLMILVLVVGGTLLYFTAALGAEVGIGNFVR